MPGPSRIGSALALSGFLAASLGVAALARPFAAAGLQTWYGTLNRPWFSPPNWVYAPVWTALYILIAVAAWLVWHAEPSHARDSGLRFWPVQLLNTFAWTGVFFGLHSPKVAIYNLLLLILSILLTLFPFLKARPLAGWLLTPFLAWCCFALYLNIGVALLNH